MNAFRLFAVLVTGFFVGIFYASPSLATEREQNAPECLETLSSLGDLPWTDRLNAQLAVRIEDRAESEMRWAALEFLFKHSDSQNKIDPVLLKLLKRIVAGESGILDLPESAPYLTVMREEIPSRSRFLKRKQREQERLGLQTVPQKKLSQVLTHKEKSLGRFKRLGLQLGLVGHKFDRMDAFFSEMRSYPQSQERRDFFIATVSALGPVTWPEVLEAMDLIDGPVNKTAAAQAALPYIFTPGEIFAAPLAERIASVSEDLKYQGKEALGRTKLFGTPLRKRALMVVVGVGLTAAGIKIGADYFSPQQSEARAKQNAIKTQQLQSAALAREQHAWQIMREGAEQWKEIQALYAKSQGVDAMAQLAREAKSPELSEEITLRHAAALAPILSPSEYEKLIASSESANRIGLADPSLRWSLWVHYLRVNSDRLTLDEVNHLLISRFPVQPEATVDEKGAVYLDYVLQKEGQADLEWWTQAISYAPDADTRDAIAFAVLKQHGAQLTPEQINSFVSRIQNATLRDRAIRMVTIQE